MFEPQEIRSEHKDVIHDVSYDYYGQRIATCSSDQTVKVNSICSRGAWKASLIFGVNRSEQTVNYLRQFSWS